MHADCETFSLLDLRKVGAYRYAQHPSTECLIWCWALDDGPVQVWLPWRSPTMPVALVTAIASGCLIGAHNAEFERQIWRYVLKGPQLPRSRWRCTAVKSAAAGLPRALDDALTAMGNEVQKDPRGKKLIRLFCGPRKPTKKNSSTRIRPTDEPAAFQEFIAYCQQDVRAERALHKALPDLNQQEWNYYQYNTLVNDRGLPLDLPLIERTTKVVRVIEEENRLRVNKLTGGINPTQRDKILGHLKELGSDLETLQLKHIERSIARANGALSPRIHELLELRLEASKASVKKLDSMAIVACENGCAHGVLLFYGAHTGRLAGKLIQPHNFTRGLLTPEQQLEVLKLFGTGDAELVRIFYDQPMHMLAQSMRGFICAPAGKRFVIADYKAIEMWVLAWLAQERSLLDIHRQNMRLPPEKRIDVYRQMASLLYHVEYLNVSKEQRRIGKNLRLGAGYQLGVSGLLANAEKEDIAMDEEFAENAIRVFRENNPATVNFWYRLEDYALEAASGRPQEFMGLHMQRWRDWFVITLPSKRNLYYYKPEIRVVPKFGKMKEQLHYLGRAVRGPTLGRWAMVPTYGGKLTENIVQSIARDLLMNGMVEAERAGYPAVASIHDEIVTLRKRDEGNVAELEKVICKLPPWANGLPLMAEGFECVRYHKG